LPLQKTPEGVEPWRRALAPVNRIDLAPPSYGVHPAIVALVLVFACAVFAWREYDHNRELAAERTKASEAAALYEQATLELAAERIARADSDALAHRATTEHAVRRAVEHATTTEDLAGYLDRAISADPGGPGVRGGAGDGGVSGAGARPGATGRTEPGRVAPRTD
jgi:hypothetical protein